MKLQTFTVRADSGPGLVAASWTVAAGAGRPGAGGRAEIGRLRSGSHPVPRFAMPPAWPDVR
jgi:hypothetical protein